MINTREMERFISSTMKKQLPSFAIIVILSFIAEKCREVVGGKEYSWSKKQRFTFMDCFDQSYGTIACIIKEIIKLYLYYIRAVHVHNVRTEETQKSLAENLSLGQTFETAMRLALEEGDASARRAVLQAKHVIGPMMSSGWDLFETLYFGGSVGEGLLRSVGTFVGAYGGGIAGEGKIGWLGFMVGSQVGSWAGARIGLMAYDVGIGFQHLIKILYLRMK